MRSANFSLISRNPARGILQVAKHGAWKLVLLVLEAFLGFSRHQYFISCQHGQTRTVEEEVTAFLSLLPPGIESRCFWNLLFSNIDTDIEPRFLQAFEDA